VNGQSTVTVLRDVVTQSVANGDMGDVSADFVKEMVGKRWYWIQEEYCCPMISAKRDGKHFLWRTVSSRERLTQITTSVVALLTSSVLVVPVCRGTQSYRCLNQHTGQTELQPTGYRSSLEAHTEGLIPGHCRGTHVEDGVTSM
jgi:hypothetical protein